jgi:hypothetical protein
MNMIVTMILGLVFLVAESIPADQWVEPFNNEENLRILCTDNNHFDVMRASPLVSLLLYNELFTLLKQVSHKAINCR